MSKYKHEKSLRTRAGRFIRALNSAGIDGAIIDESVREYSIAVSVARDGESFGRAIIYYSPKTDSFSMKTQELKDKSIAPHLEASWTATEEAESPAQYEIYVDGSFINGATGYGAVVLKNGKVVDELSGLVAVSEVNDTRQVAGELFAVKEAVNWCDRHSVKEVSIYYDYLGIEKWATRQWKTNQPLTKEYARFLNDCSIKIHWHKVNSHTGNRWNDRADALAKIGAGSKQAIKGELDTVTELIEHTKAWIEFLMAKGIDARFDRVYNDQFARVFIQRDDKAVGTFDLYNTRKKRMSPYLHDFRNEGLQLEIATLWKEFARV